MKWEDLYQNMMNGGLRPNIPTMEIGGLCCAVGWLLTLLAFFTSLNFFELFLHRYRVVVINASDAHSHPVPAE